MHIISKRGSQDNVITYEHICDTQADMASIENKYITLGSVCIVLQGQDGAMEVYMADSSKQWRSIIVNTGANSDSSVAGLLSALNGKQDAPSLSGTEGQVLGLDENLDPVWLDQTGENGGNAIMLGSGNMIGSMYGADSKNIKYTIYKIEPGLSMENLIGKKVAFNSFLTDKDGSISESIITSQDSAVLEVNSIKVTATSGIYISADLLSKPIPPGLTEKDLFDLTIVDAQENEIPVADVIYDTAGEIYTIILGSSTVDYYYAYNPNSGMLTKREGDE